MIINITEPHFSVRRERSSSVTFKTWVRFPSAPPRKHMNSFREKMEFSLLERLPSSQRMREHDEAGKKSKKTKNSHTHEHFRKDWAKDLWE